jgi:hypothetical protein
VARRRRREGLEKPVAGTHGTGTIVYVDNVPLSAGEALANSSSGTTRSQTYNSKSLGLQSNVSDTTFYDALGERLVTEGLAGAIVFTADRGKGNPEILKAIDNHEKNGDICTVMVSLKSLNSTDVSSAAAALPTLVGFKDINTYAVRFTKIVLSKSGTSLQVYAQRRNGNIINKVFKRVFTEHN